MPGPPSPEPTLEDIEALLRASGLVQPRDGGWLLVSSVGLERRVAWVERLPATPEVGSEELERLERARLAHQADVAVGICPDGSPGSAPGDGPASVRRVSLRQLADEVLVRPERAQREIAEFEDADWIELPWRGWSSGVEVDALDHLDEWLGDRRRPSLILSGSPVARLHVQRCASHRAARRQFSGVGPLLDTVGWYGYRELARRLCAVVYAVELVSPPPLVTLQRLFEDRSLILADEEMFAHGAAPAGVETLGLRPFEEGELRRWLLAQHAPSARASLDAALADHRDLAVLCDDPVHFPAILHATRAGFDPARASFDPVAVTVMDYVRRSLGAPLSDYHARWIAELEEIAFADYAGAGRRRLFHVEIMHRDDPRVLSWLEMDPEERGSARFANEAVRNCFVAMKIAREALLGRRDILERHRFPERDIQHHLRLLLPGDLVDRLHR